MPNQRPEFAFPDPAPSEDGQPGLTIRDWFATFLPPTEWEMKHAREMEHARSQADESRTLKERDSYKLAAEIRYRNADAMLAEREKSR